MSSLHNDVDHTRDVTPRHWGFTKMSNICSIIDLWGAGSAPEAKPRFDPGTAIYISRKNAKRQLHNIVLGDPFPQAMLRC